MSYSSIEKTLRCPFDETHAIIPHRMATHISSCQKNFLHLSFVRCCFNASHVVRSEDMHAHILQCPDKAQVERDIYITTQQAAAPRAQTPSHAIITPTPPCEEDWESEFTDTTTTYNAALNAIYLPVPRKIPVGLSKSAKESWRCQDIERVRLLKEGLGIEELMADELVALGVLERPPPVPERPPSVPEPEQNSDQPSNLDEKEVLLLGGACGGKAFETLDNLNTNSGVLPMESARSKNNAAAVLKDEEIAKPTDKKVNNYAAAVLKSKETAKPKDKWEVTNNNAAAAWKHEETAKPTNKWEVTNNNAAAVWKDEETAKPTNKWEVKNHNVASVWKDKEIPKPIDKRKVNNAAAVWKDEETVKPKDKWEVTNNAAAALKDEKTAKEANKWKVTNKNAAAAWKDEETAKPKDKWKENFSGNGNAAGQDKQKNKKIKKKQVLLTNWQVVGQRNPPKNWKNEIEGMTENLKNLNLKK